MNDENFNVNNGVKDKYNMLCKKCQKIDGNKRYMDDRAHRLAKAIQWKKDHPEEYKVQQREYKRKVNGYYEKHSKEILSKADDSLKDNRDAEIIEIGIDLKDKEPNDE